MLTSGVRSEVSTSSATRDYREREGIFYRGKSETELGKRGMDVIRAPVTLLTDSTSPFGIDPFGHILKLEGWILEQPSLQPGQRERWGPGGWEPVKFILSQSFHFPN